MKHFKNLNSGFSFIEIMAALTLLSIFGTSIFLVQNSIFSKAYKTHQLLLFSQNFSYNLLELKNKIDKAILNKESIDTIKIHTDKKNPDRTVDIKTLAISNESELNKFSKNLRIVQNSTTFDNQSTITWFNLIYIPQKLDNEKTKEKQA